MTEVATNPGVATKATKEEAEVVATTTEAAEAEVAVVIKAAVDFNNRVLKFSTENQANRCSLFQTTSKFQPAINLELSTFTVSKLCQTLISEIRTEL